MIAGCPKCSARYRVDPERISGEGAKLRCTKCSAVFLVRAPKPAAQPAPPTQMPVPSSPEAPMPQASPSANAAEEAHRESPDVVDSGVESKGRIDRERLVLVADSDEDRAKATANAIQAWELAPLVVHDGVEAMMAIARMQPRAVVLDAALGKMYGFQVCEVVKRIESLSSTCVVLVGAVDEESRFRAEASDVYGADVHLEHPDVPEGLHPLLRAAGLPVKDALEPEPEHAPRPEPEPVVRVAPAPPSAVEEESFTFETEPPSGPAPVMEPPPSASAPLSAPAPQPVAISEAPAPAAAVAPEADVAQPENQEEIERAERLARIAVSEMVLYQPDKFDQAAREGNLTSVLDLEIQEARALIRQRVSEKVRADRDFILEELSRVARDRGVVG